MAPITDAGELDMAAFASASSTRTRMVAVVWVSNALGTINPVAEIVELAHARGVPVLIDGAQAVPHLPVDVQALGADFYVFSGHKLYGPIGHRRALRARPSCLEAMPPYQGGGDMIDHVTLRAGRPTTTCRTSFEAGTPDIAGIVGLGAAIDYVEGLGHRRHRGARAAISWPTARGR